MPKGMHEVETVPLFQPKIKKEIVDPNKEIQRKRFKIAVGVLIFDAALGMIKKMPKKPLNVCLQKSTGLPTAA